MHRVLTGIALCLLLIGGSPAPADPLASTQDQEPERAFEGQEIVWPTFPDAPDDAPLARIGFVFDPVSRSREASAPVAEPVDVYLVAWNVQVALHAWEARLEIDPRLNILETEYFSDLKLVSAGDTRAMLQPQNCNPSSEIILVHYQVLCTDPDARDLVLGIGPASRPSVPTVETDAPWPSPIYQVCRPKKDVRPFLFSPVSAVLNPDQVHPDPIGGEKATPDFKPAHGRH